MITLLRSILIFNLTPLILGLLILSNEKVIKSIFLGWIIVLFGVLIGIITFELAKKKDNKNFLKIYFGGMILRLFILLSLIFVSLKFIGINPLSFLFSLFIFYIINQIIELRYILRSTKKYD